MAKMNKLYKMSLIGKPSKAIPQRQNAGSTRRKNIFAKYCPLCLDFRYWCTSQYTTLIF